QARLSQPLHPPFRRHGVRAGRPAGQQAAPRDGVRASQIFRQAVHRLGDQARARRDSVRICELLFGEEFVRDNTVLTSLINANSPLVWDSAMIGAAEVYARANQACIITPFILSGAMSPVTIAGTLTQVLAEVMAGTAFCQLTRPGAPVVFGTFVSTLSMQSGAPTFGTPEAALAIFGAGQ